MSFWQEIGITCTDFVLPARCLWRLSGARSGLRRFICCRAGQRVMLRVSDQIQYCRGQIVDLAAERTRTSAPKKDEDVRPFANQNLAEALEQHVQWLDSNGDAGVRADFSLENLEDADLTDAILQDAILNKTILKRADLMLADLRGASLLQANLMNAKLLGTEFQQANLQGARLDDATGLSSSKLAGANLLGAVLPSEISPFEELKNVGEVAYRAGWLLVSVLLLNALTWLRIFTTRDSELLKNSPALPFFGLQTQMPFIPFYLFGPVVILSVYICFHLYLQRLWDGAAQLPAVFPDGQSLDARLPWFARWAAQKNFIWLNNNRSPLAFLETGIAMLLLYWIAPLTALLFWARYLTLEDMRGSALHVLLVVGGVSAAMNFPRMAGKAFAHDSPPFNQPKQPPSQKTALVRNGAPLGIGAFILLLSIGTILGAPHGSGRTTQSGSSGIETLAANALWCIGYNPFAQLTEMNVSTKPSAWSGRDEEIATVKGANLNGLRLRYMQAYGAFLANARFLQADLRNANLSEADLRGANLRQADLRFAIFDRAKLNRASLQEANLQGTILTQADLRDANINFADLSGATLLDSTLDGASLYKADLRAASMQRASLKRADLRETNLESADLTMASLQESYLTSSKLGNARLRQTNLSLAILMDADLRKSDLSGSDLRGASLLGADLRGANLQGADLRGTLGITTEQVCSTTNGAQALMDENLQREVDNLCGNTRWPISNGIDGIAIPKR